MGNRFNPSPNELYHWKYVRKYRSNGEWRYEYPAEERRAALLAKGRMDRLYQALRVQNSRVDKTGALYRKGADNGKRVIDSDEQRKRLNRLTAAYDVRSQYRQAASNADAEYRRALRAVDETPHPRNNVDARTAYELSNLGNSYIKPHTRTKAVSSFTDQLIDKGKAALDAIKNMPSIADLFRKKSKG